jgi:ankyrin repeat protein
MAAAGMGVSQRDRNLPQDEVEARAIAVLTALLEAGADINARVTDTQSRTARIARPSTMSERLGQTALYGAVKFAWPNVVAFLLANGADPRVKDALGHTPLDAAQGRTGGRDNRPSPEVAAILQRELVAR